MGELFRRFRYLLHQRRLQRELANDMEFHREMAARSGNSNFGNVLRMQEQAREAWGWMWIDRLMQDLRYAARILRRSPGFTIAAVLVLAIGVGANVMAFSLFNLDALKPLPIRDPDSIVRLERRLHQLSGLVSLRGRSGRARQDSPLLPLRRARRSSRHTPQPPHRNRRHQQGSDE